MTDYPLITVGGLIFAQDGDVLLVKSKKWIDCYSLPGGKVELGETLEQAFTREIKEETGLDLQDISFVMAQESIFSAQFYKKSHFLMHDFVANLQPHCKKSEVVLNDEAEEWLWVPLKKAREMPLNKEAYVLIDKYLQKFGLVGVKDYKISCFIGDNPEEFNKPQDIFLDFEVEIDIAPSAKSDALYDTVNYVELARRATLVANAQHIRLLEKLAYTLVEEFLSFEKVKRAYVRIKKPLAIPTSAYTYVEYEGKK